MAVGTFLQPDFETQNATLYKGSIDNSIAAMARIGAAFAPHESDPAAMTVTVDAGALLVSGQLVEVAAQTTGTITAPDANPRIDLVYIDPADDGAVGVAAGSEAADPDPPALPSGMLPVCEVLMATDTTAISNQLITDRRVGAGGGGGGLNPGEPSELTIDAGAVTVTGGYHTIRNESGAGTDDLDSIDASALGEGELLILAAGDPGEVPTLRSGEDNITLSGPNYALDAAAKRIVLQKTAGGGLVEVARSHAAGLQIGAVQATTSGTAKDFTGIPAGTRQIVVSFNEVSLDGSDNILVQIGDSGGLETSGYLATGSSIINTTTASTNSAAGFVLRVSADAQVTSGSMILTLVDPATNTWVVSGTAKSNTNTTQVLGGSKALSAELDRLRITRSGGNSFDAGSVNILYQ